MGQQHGIDIVLNHHARDRLVGKLRVERKAETLEERLDLSMFLRQVTKIFVGMASSTSATYSVSVTFTLLHRAAAGIASSLILSTSVLLVTRTFLSRCRNQGRVKPALRAAAPAVRPAAYSSARRRPTAAREGPAFSSAPPQHHVQIGVGNAELAAEQVVSSQSTREEVKPLRTASSAACFSTRWWGRSSARTACAARSR